MARTNKTGLTPAVINDWIGRINPETGKKYTLTDIANAYGVSHQYVSWVKSTYGGVHQSPQEAVRKHWPWKVPVNQQRSNPCRMLRAHLHYQATGGKGMSEKKLKELRGFYRRLIDNNLVVEFDPDIPPAYGSVATGGWAFRDKVPSDGKLIIRVNSHTAPLSEETQEYWRLPRILPE